MNEQKTNIYLIPMAIVIAGVLIAGTVYLTNTESGNEVNGNNKNNSAGDVSEEIKAVSEEDHILGNLDAPVKIIEYSDLECPFCKTFHETMINIMGDYNDESQIAWVYRHFPLTNIHPKAFNAAVASECAAEEGGDEAFWKYITGYFNITPSNNNIDLSQLPLIAESIGVNKDAFEECLVSGRYDEKIQDHQEDGLNAGAQGTPYSVVINSEGKKFIINGAQPYESVKAIIERALGE